jgi:hypothetical protein
VRDPEAIFCSRCGTPLKREDETSAGQVTEAGATAPPEDRGAEASGPSHETGYDPGPSPGSAGPPAEGAVTAQQHPGPPDRPSIESPYGGYQAGRPIEPDATE